MTTKGTSAIRETVKHIQNVCNFLNLFAKELFERSIYHDRSKLEYPESEEFAKYTSCLAGTTYGSKEYKQLLKKLESTLTHHYKHNRHHPEHFANGVDGMNLVDLVEMFCDWKAATMRHNDGDLTKSIIINSDRFNMSPQLVSIFLNSVSLFEGKDVSNRK